ncbi:MAG: VOC family protein [Bacteroidetes bacterium]|nr:VOC family protein [Bacteroidota bacterium]
MKKIYQYVSIILLPLLFIIPPAHAQVLKTDAVNITVKEMDRSLQFYTDVLGFTKVDEWYIKGDKAEKLQGLFGIHIRVARLQLGDEFIELTDYLTTGGRSIPEDAKSNDLFFQHIAIVVSDMDKAFEQVKAKGVTFVSTEPQTLPPTIPAAAGIKAFYFQDPDRHNLELIFFPVGKGQDKWQHPKGKIFLGIDHTAIGVSNTEKSHQFYSTLLGLDRKGDSWNKGNEQEHLNNVEGASLHITGYRAAAGPRIEFLQYIVPGPGKLYPSDSRTDDIWHWQTILRVNDANALYQKLKQDGYTIVSKGLIEEWQGQKRMISFIVRDPDGHALLIREEQ